MSWGPDNAHIRKSYGLRDEPGPAPASRARNNYPPGQKSDERSDKDLGGSLHCTIIQILQFRRTILPGEFGQLRTDKLQSTRQRALACDTAGEQIDSAANRRLIGSRTFRETTNSSDRLLHLCLLLNTLKSWRAGVRRPREGNTPG